MEKQPYGIEIWDTSVAGTSTTMPLKCYYYWRLYYTSNGQQAATSGYYASKHERDKYAQQVIDWFNGEAGQIRTPAVWMTLRDRHPAGNQGEATND